MRMKTVSRLTESSTASRSLLKQVCVCGTLSLSLRAIHLIRFPSLGVAKTAEVDKLRFTDKDLAVIGTLEYGQFSVVRRGPS